MADEGADPGFDEDRVRHCPAGETLRGVDVSYYQGKVDWPEVKRQGVVFAFVRVSDGAEFVDPELPRNWAGTRAAGVVRGAYQFFRPAQDPVAQARVLVEQLKKNGGVEDGDIPPTLDIEVSDGVASDVLLARAEAWLGYVEAAFGRTPLIYTAPGFWDDLGASTRFSRYPLWVANWASCPALPRSWERWAFWQTTDSGTIPGIEGAVDLDRFNGSLADLRAFTRSRGEPPRADPRPNPRGNSRPEKPRRAKAPPRGGRAPTDILGQVFGAVVNATRRAGPR